MGSAFVVDNSVVMSWCFKDEANRYADSVLDRIADATAVVPSIWPLEVVNVLLVAERMKRISEADSIRFVTLLNQLPITIEQDQPDRIMNELINLAREHGLSSYDACYFDLAMRMGLPIATLDKHLKSAAKKARVPLFK